MGDTPTTTNTAASAADTILKEVIYNVALKAMVSAAVVDQPWLALPVINQIFKAICKLFADKFYKAATTIATFDIIDIQVDSERNALNASKINLFNAIQTGDQNAIYKAQADFENNLGRLIHWDGS